MKVKELIEILKGYDPDIEVILQKDAEGYVYSPLAGAEPSLYVWGTTYPGVETLHPEDVAGSKEDGSSEVSVIILYPKN